MIIRLIISVASEIFPFSYLLILSMEFAKFSYKIITTIIRKCMI
jgi:hypothetical protein